MRSALAAAVLIVVANTVVFVSASRERSAPATFTTVEVCANQLMGGAGSDDPPALRLTLVRDTSTTPRGLDSAGLRALGFDQSDIAKVGRPRVDSARWTLERPAWVRLQQRQDSLRWFHAVEVAPRREQLAPDSTSLIIRGLVAIRWLGDGPPQQHADGGPAADIIYPVVDEVIPAMLHLDRQQIADLRAALPDSVGCTITRQVRVAQGAKSGIWVHDIP
jgi:hypothetical protein